MDTRALLQNWDAAYQSQAPQWAHNANVLQWNADTTAATGGGGQVIAGAPIMLPPGMAFGKDPGTMEFKQNKPNKRNMLPFGGAFARGGIAPAGKVSLVGEDSAELIIPTGPTAVIPLGKRPRTDNNPVNGRPATFDGMPRTQFFSRNSGKTSGTVPVYNDIRTTFNGGTPRPDPRSFGTGGQNFTGPMPMPGTKPTLDATTGAPVSDPRPAPGSAPAAPRQGMLVASSSGGYKWQPGTGPGTSAPPQSSQPAAPAAGALPFGQRMPTLPGKAAPFNDTGSAMDRHMSTGLAGSARRPVGRSANDPQRIAERMRRQGDPRAIMQFGMQQRQQDFAREQNAVNFDQSLMMFGMQEGAAATRDARNFQQGVQMQDMHNQAAAARDAQNFQQYQQIRAQEEAAAKAAEAEARNFGLQPVQVPGTSTPFFTDSRGRIHAGGQPERAPDPMPKGLEPKAYQDGRTIYGRPDTPENERVIIRELPGEMVQDPKTMQWKTQPGKTVRIFPDGTFEEIKPRGTETAAGAPTPAPAAMTPAERLAALRRRALGK